MQLQIWSDYACPYCYIGKRHLEQALAEFEHAADVEIVFRAFELNPSASRKVVDTTQQRIEYKYGKSPAAAREMIDHIMKMGERAGVAMRYDTVRYTCTFDAHRLSKFAQTRDVGAAMTERLFRAYFIDNRELADIPSLIGLAVELGLDGKDVSRMLASNAYADIVRADETEASRLGIHGVPHFVFNGEMDLSGAHSKATLLRALRQSWERFKAPSGGEAPSCGSDACDASTRA